MSGNAYRVVALQNTAIIRVVFRVEQTPERMLHFAESFRNMFDVVQVNLKGRSEMEVIFQTEATRNFFVEQWKIRYYQ